MLARCAVKVEDRWCTHSRCSQRHSRFPWIEETDLPHELEHKYGLTADELLEAINRRFRLKVALEGAVAEVHFARKLRLATQEGWLADYQEHDEDGKHDFTVRTIKGRSIRVEVKTLRIKATWKVELQKTRAAKADPSSRYYDAGQFDVVAVCLGRAHGDWSSFRYCLANALPRHRNYPGKLQVMHNVPEETPQSGTWYEKFQDVIDAYEEHSGL